MNAYSQAEASRLLGCAATNMVRWVQRRQARNIEVPGANPDGSFTDEFIEFWKDEHASGRTTTGGRTQFRHRREYQQLAPTVPVSQRAETAPRSETARVEPILPTAAPTTGAPSMQPRACQVCHATFTPPQRATSLSLGDNHLRLCASCRRVAMDSAEGHDAPPDTPVIHQNASGVAGAPMRQVVFDLETWGLDRGWGVTMIASFLIHGGAGGPERITLRQRDSAAWKAGRRSDDREISERIIDILKGCHIGYAHNGDRFDVKWLRTVALKHGLEMPRLKLVDPCSIAWKKYLIGRNSLEAVADFLGISEEKEGQKVHLSPDVWRGALMDDDDECWRNLVVRCESDVEILNRISARVTRDVGMVDYSGSWR